MPVCGEIGDSPAILQLQKWSQLQFQLELSEFREASISPTRELLLLLSHQSGALLLPLIFGKGPSSTLTNYDESSRLQPKNLQGPSSLPASPRDQTNFCRSDSIAHALGAINATGNDSSFIYKYHPIITNVKSFTWGHYGDAYSQKDTGFREFLIVVGDDDITVHGFRYPEQNSYTIDPEPDAATVHGKWVEWGPTQSTPAKKPFSHSDSFDNFNEVNKIRGTGGKQHSHSLNDPDLSSSSSIQKKWFRSFLTEVDIIESDGKCLTRFPAEKSYPHSAEVVSFSIYDITSRFLEFLCCTSPLSCKVDQSEEIEPGQVGDLPIYDFQQGTPSHLDYKATHGGILYQCSKAFSSSSHRLVGLVLTLSENASISNQEHQRVSNKSLVVVFVLYQWGIQWACRVDLHSRFPGPDHLEWVDFKFSENFLICLNTSGLICIWGAETGKFVAHLDVLQSCGMDTKSFSEFNKKNLFVNRDSAPKMASIDGEADQGSGTDASETSSRGLVCSRTFRKLMVSSHSLLLAITDDNGVIYVVSADEYISENQYVFNEFAPPSDLGILASWKIAGHETVGRKVFPDLFCGQGLHVSDLSNEVTSNTNYDAKFWRTRKHSTEWKEKQLNTYSSGFTTASQIKSRKVPHSGSKISPAPIRRVFLPLDRFNKEDYVCFSPFGITRVVKTSNVNERKGYKVVHTGLHVSPSVSNKGDVDICWLSRRCSSNETAFIGESIGCSFQGCLYLVTQDGISVILPSVSVSSDALSAESNRYWQPSTVSSLGLNESKGPHRPWRMEVLDRILLYEGPDEAECICLKNGWDLRFARVRRLQLALHYLKSEEIEKSLDMLVGVNLAEEGILRLLFTSVYQISGKVGGDNEVTLASRFLALASSFATKMVRRYGLVEHRKDKSMESVDNNADVSYLHQVWPMHHWIKISNSRRLQEMAHFLEVIRNLQSRLATRNRRPGQGEMADSDVATKMGDSDVLRDDSFPIVTVNAESSGLVDAFKVQPKGDFAVTAPDLGFSNIDNPALCATEYSVDVTNFHGLYDQDSGSFQRRNLTPLENPKDMIARWAMDNLDFKAVVKDALQSGRLPLAVLQLHLHRQKELVSEKEYHDIFSEVREIGRAISYDLFLKGENGLAMATLQKLGEDVEFILRQLLLGTVRRSLRAQISVEMRKYGWLRPDELKTLERISVIERLYPSSSFWGTFLARQKSIDEKVPLLSPPEANKLKLSFHVCDDLSIQCGDIDGVVIGVWKNVSSDSAFSSDCEDNAQAVYWACAAVWSDAWDSRTMDRIVLDQPFHMGVHIPWESQFEYHLYHNDLEEVYRLLDVIPTYLLVEGTLKVTLDSSRSSANVGTSVNFPDYAVYCAAEELEPMLMDIPNVKVLRSSAIHTCSSWLKMLVEQELAKKYIFVKEYWYNTAEIMPLLAKAGLIIDTSKISQEGEPSKRSLDLDIFGIEQSHNDTAEALHVLVLHHCIQYNLPNLLDLYLDHHNLVLDDNSLSLLLEAAGDCQWAKWLLFSRIKGREYDASFCNARSNLSRQMTLGSNLSVLEIDEIIRTVDDMAEGGGEMAALATLMYASVPMQQCLCSGSVNRHCSSSFQCTLENLRPSLQKFPTLWRALVAACFGSDADDYSFSSRAVFGRSSFSDYVSWRYNVFSSSGGDTSLIQMLPCWFPKSIRRLIKLFVQGPLGWHSLSDEEQTSGSFLYQGNNYPFNANDDAGIRAITWEATIQKSIEELYSSLKDNGFGLEHHLHRGRALAAFNHVLGLRALKLKSTNAMSGQSNIQSDVQMILSPLTQSEGSLLSSVMPLAIMHFEDSVLVASCAFLLELCGLSASMVRVDIAALRRISSYYNMTEHNGLHEHVSPRASAFHSVSREGDFTASLARSLADDYMNHNNLEKKGVSDEVSTSKQLSRALMTVLQHLENASLPLMNADGTCGLWLSSGNGDGFEFRNQQKDASQRWSLVTAFCQMHHLPLSTRYLALLANDNDWVGFLTEAQLVGFSIDIVIQVASQEFSDPRLKTHILTVLKSMQSTRRKTSSSSNAPSPGRSCEVPFSTDNNSIVPMELFGILAECEKQKNPGESLLLKAKDLCWSLLAMIASCFPDVSPLSCLSVWLEITAARETSSIKVNDISSKIANCVGAAVEATNLLPTGSRTVTFHYNRRNSKRKRMMEPSSRNCMTDTSTAPNSPNSMIYSLAQEMTDEEEKLKMVSEQSKVSSDSDGGLASLSNMVAVLCEQRLFLPLLRAFEMFMPSCSLLPFIRSLQAFSQMRLSEASAHLASFSARIREEPFLAQINLGKDEKVKTAWTSSTAVKAAEAVLSTCPSAYEKRCLLQLLSAADFGDGGSASTYFRRLHWKINLAEPSLRKNDDVYLGNETLDDYSLLTALEKNGHWEQARNWARQLESSGALWKSAVHHVTETQAEAMVAEWKEFLWDIPEERAALWNHCQTLFLRFSFPALQAGSFFLRHAGAIEKESPPRELHEMLLLSLQWLSGTMTQTNPVYPLHLLREIETRVWHLAVESEVQSKAEGNFTLPNSVQNLVEGNSNSIIEQTANIITKMDNHLNSIRMRATERNGTREINLPHHRQFQVSDSNIPVTVGSSSRMKRRAKNVMPLRRPVVDNVDDSDDHLSSPHNRNSSDLSKNLQLQDESLKIEASLSAWEERVRPAELERAVLSLLEFGQVTAAKQLQQKLSPAHVPFEFLIVDAALKVADLSSSSSSGEISVALLDSELRSFIQSLNIMSSNHMIDSFQVLESLADKCGQGCGHGLCRRIIAVAKAAKILVLPFAEAFEKRPLELLQLLSLKAQESLEEAKLVVQTHVISPSSIARVLAESFLKGLLAAHRGGYMDSQKEEGPAPLLWRFSDFLKWAELCPSEPEIGHALMRLVMTGQDIPHACEVELLILSHHFYKSSACLDGVDVLVTLAANRVESYVSEGDFSCLARLITGVSNFHALNFILNILIENGQLELLLQKYSSADADTGTAEAVRGFRMAVLTSLKLFNPHDLDAFAMVYSHFDMKHETAALLESRSMLHMQQWLSRRDKDRQNEDLLESMRYLIEAAQVLSTIDAGHKTHRACARASLLSLQIRIPDLNWVELSETNARRAFVEQSRFQEALIVAEAYKLNQPSEWAPVLWNLMLKPDLIEQFVAEFVAVLPLQSSMLLELAKFYRAEVAARGDQFHFSVWLSPGGLPAEWVKHLGRSFRSLLRRTRDLRLRLQLATIATGFGDVTKECMKVLDKVPDNAGPLILRRGHGGAYLPLM